MSITNSVHVAINAAIEETLTNLRERLASDLDATKRSRDDLAYDDPAWMRRAGRVDGIKLALSYVDEALRAAKPAEEAAR